MLRTLRGDCLDRAAGLGPVLLRLTLAGIMIYHGSDKLFNWSGSGGLEGFAGHVGGLGLPGPAVFWAGLAAGSEFVGGILVALGLFTRLGALFILGVMAVAIFKVHWANGFSARAGGFEYPLALAGVCLTLIFSGGGTASVDEQLLPTKRPKPAPPA